MRDRPELFARALAVFAPGPAARSALALFELFLGPADAALASCVLLRVLDPADELVACERRDVAPGSERHHVRKQRLRAHWEAIAAADFFTVEVLTLHADQDGAGQQQLRSPAFSKDLVLAHYALGEHFIVLVITDGEPTCSDDLEALERYPVLLVIAPTLQPVRRLSE